MSAFGDGMKVWQAMRGTLWAALLLTVLPHAATATEFVLDTRVGEHPDKTRLVVETTASTAFNVSTQNGPDRVTVDFTGLSWSAPPESKGKGLIRRYESQALDGDRMRLVLETTRPVVANAAFIPPRDGHAARFVLDLHPVEPALVPASMTLPTPPATASVAPLVSPAVLGVPLPPKPPSARVPRKPIIVLDPGHGGVDPGAIGVSGTHEKDITLGIARTLKAQLEATGQYQVVLTRKDDTFIRLRERVARARQAGASLFVSLHADSIERPEVRGLSVYTLSDTASDREAAALADKENRVDKIAGVDVGAEDDDVVGILIDLAQRETMNQSRRFARTLIDELQGDIALLNSPQRSAGFAVLTAPDVPSALIELGYMSNSQDVKLLGSSGHQQKLAREIARAIDTFFRSQMLVNG